MELRSIAGATLMSIVSVGSSALGADRLRVGQYEITTTTDGKTQTDSVCQTPDMAKIANGDAKAGREYLEKKLERFGKGRCTVNAYDVTGDTVSSTTACGESVTTTRTTYHGDSSESDVTTRAGGKTVSVHTTAKRVGDCK
jgi:ketosteroid isomerase-like protein